MRKKEKPEEKIMTALELARRQMIKHLGGTCSCEIDRMTRQCSVALGYLYRMDQEEGIFGPLVECLKKIANEDYRVNRSPASESAYRTLETFYKENPSWNG